MHLCSKAVCGNGGGSVGLKAQRQPVSNAPGSLIVPLHRHPTLPRNTLLVSTTHHRAPCVHASTGAGAAAPLPDPRGPAPNASPVSPTPTSPDASSSSKPDGAPAAAAGAAAAASSGAAEVTENKGLLQRAKEWVFGSKFDKDKLAALGMGAFASYGTISNVTYGICVGIAWIAFVKQYGVSPLASGQWKPFLAFYAGLWTFQNIIRPLRFSLAIALAPLFERFILAIAARTGLKKQYAFGVLLAIIAVATTVSLFGGIYLFGGFPPPPPPATA